MALSNLSIHFTWKDVKRSYKNKKLNISTPTLNEKINLPRGWHSVLNVHDYSEYIIKKYENLRRKYILIK